MKNTKTFNIGDTVIYVGTEEEIHGELADISEVFKDRGEWCVVFNLHRDGSEWCVPEKDCRRVKFIDANRECA